MSLDDEQADILGGPLLQKPQHDLFGVLIQHLVAFKGAAAVFLGLLAWAAFVHLREYIRRNRDLNYRKAMRRKHGIPDSDCRPFAVAYAAANRARTEREARERNKLAGHVPSVSVSLQPGDNQHRIPLVGAPHGGHQLRRRLPESIDARGPSPFHNFPGIAKRVQVQDFKRPDVDPLNSTERYNPNTRHSRQLPGSAHGAVSSNRKPAARRFSRKTLHIDHDVVESSRKRSYASESDAEPDNNMKKTRIDGEDLIDGDENPDWYAQYTYPRSQPVASSSRVSITDQSNGHEADEPIDEIMEDLEDEVTELSSIPRGKKRDRAEAGSTFGADDDDDVHNEKPTYHRKRRSVSKRKSEARPRGRKRDRETEFPESEGEGAVAESVKRDSQRTSKKRKGKRASSDESKMDTSMEDTRVSKDPLCGGRKIGEEWEAGAVRYKVGDKGERLRLVLVKKARNKYHMPEDSQHPDRAAALEIYVETWMTEEQYKQAEERQDVVLQDVRPLTESTSPGPPESPSKKGKDLLWDSVTSSPISRRPFRQSLTANTTARINPFQQSQTQPNLSRRIGSPSASVSPHLVGVTESPTRLGFRGFSKWEKQDREAEAMAKIRAKMLEQKKSEAVKSSEPPTSAVAPQSCAQTLTVPAITLTPASPSPVEGKSMMTEAKSVPSFPFGQPSTVKAEANTSTPNTSATSGFSVLPSTAPASSSATPSVPQPSTSAPATAPSSTPSFSFAPPMQVPTAAAPTTTTIPSSSTSVPSFSTKPTAPTATPAPSTTPSFSFAAPAQTQPSSGTAALTTEAPKAPAFSFSKPSAPAMASQASATPSTSTPATTAPASTSAFTPTPATWQTASPAASATAPPGSKPSAPVFSFSATPSAATTSSAAPLPSKFSFGQSSASPAFSTANSSTVTDDKPKFTFGTPTVSSGGSAAGQTKKESAPPSMFSGATGAKLPAFGSSTFGVPSSTSTFGKQTEAGAGANATNGSGSSDTAPKPAFGTGTSTNIFSATAAASSPSTGTTNSTFSFGNPTSPSKSVSSFGNTGFGSSGSMSSFAFGKKDDTASAAAVSNGTSTKFSFAPSSNTPAFGQSNTSTSGESNVAPSSSAPTFSFGTPSGGATSVFGQRPSPATKDASAAASDASSKPTFSFNTSANNATSASSQAPPSANTASSSATAKPPLPFGAPTNGATLAAAPGSSSSTTATEAPKSTFSFTGSQSGNTASVFGSAPGNDFAPKPTFSFNPPSGTGSSSSEQPSTATKPMFGALNVAPSSVFGGQPSTSSTTDPSAQPQSMFGKPPATAPSTFGFGTTPGNTTFTFGKPASQNQKQEQ